MSRFTETAAVATRTTNRAGGEAFTMDARMQLVSIALTSFVQDQFYRSASDTLAELITAIEHVDGKFAAKTALFARNEFGMRSITHVIGAEIARIHKGTDWLRPFIAGLCRRPDDAIEMIGYTMGKYGKRKIPNGLRRGIADAFDKWDEYQIAKYRGEGKTPSLIDVVNLTHPKPTDENKTALEGLVKGTLREFDTWEAELSKPGADKAEVWTGLITSRKLGYFALLRNLRNILKDAPNVVDAACVMLTDEKLIRKSLVLPFRFYTAHEQLSEVEGSGKVLEAINAALEISVANVPTFEGRTLIAIDSSGSMTGRFGMHSNKGGRAPIEQAALLGGALVKSNDADIMLFDGTKQMVSYMAGTPLNSIVSDIRSKARGGTTDFSLPFSSDVPYGRIMILSDMQGWTESYGQRNDTAPRSLAAYTARTGAKPFVYSFDLTGYGSMELPADRIFTLAGFSEKIFDVMKLMETDRNALINRIETVEI